jgi:O-succinylbenzoate synthase
VALTGTSTRLRATAAAISMVLAGERPSLSEVARLAGVSRQALRQGHQPVVAFVSELRATWVPRTPPEVASVQEELALTQADLKQAREEARTARAERDRALHHLVVAEDHLRVMQRADADNVHLVDFGRET